MSYQLQRVLPRNFQPPRVRGLGVAPPSAGAIVSGSVPAYPVLLPTLDQFTAAHASARPVNMVPSLRPRRPAVQGARIFPVSPAGVMPAARDSMMSGLAAYVAAPSPLPLTATWGLGAYRPRGLGACGCSGSQGTCSCGMSGLGDFDLGQITLPVVGEIDVKSVALVVGAFLLARKLMGAGQRKVRQYGVRAPIYRRAEA